jgi:hypothetical protein
MERWRDGEEVNNKGYYSWEELYRVLKGFVPLPSLAFPIY